MDIDRPKMGTMAAATLAAAAINSVLTGNKRGRDVTEGSATGGGQGTTVDQRPHLHVGGDSMTVRMAKARTREKAPVRSRLQRLLQEMKLKETSIVSRFQWLTTNAYTDPTMNLKYQLNKQWPDANEGPGYKQDMPVYCFNLSSLPYATQTSFTEPSIPFYRLTKLVNALGATDATTHNYTWKEIAGQQRDNPANDWYPWTLEKTSGNDSAQRTNRHYLWNWSDIELAFKAPNLTPTRVHVCLVQFPNECAAPIRKYMTAGAPTAYDTLPTDPQRISESDLWYDSFLARKTVHPLRYVQPMDKNKPVTFLSKECICLEPGRDYSKGVFTSKIFHTANKLLRCVNPNKAEAAHMAGINTAVGWSKPPVTWNQDYNTDKQTGFPDRRKDTWLMIYAEDFNSVNKYTDSYPANSASFDLMIRSKWTISSE